jgi:hypothetical protein
MPFLDYPQSEFSKNKDKVKGMSRAKKVVRNLRRATRSTTTSLDIPLLPKDRSIAGVKFTKTQAKEVRKNRDTVHKKNKKMAKTIWRKLF